MINNKFTRRKFLDYAKLSFVFFLSSCQSLSKNISIGLHKKFIPEILLDSFPRNWIGENINFKDKNFANISRDKDIFLINDGWLNRLNLLEFSDISDSLFTKLDERSYKYLSNWDKSVRKKLFPIGVIPYAVIIKNNNQHKITNRDSWDFLLSKKFTGKMILPNSVRILISIADKINNKNSIKALLNQENIYDDKNAIDWLINTDSVLAIMPITYCKKYLKFDSRLTILFPNQGVPLMWNFLLIRKNLNNKDLSDYIDKISSKNITNKLTRDGWYLPFKNEYIQARNNNILKAKKFDIQPSEECWKNSWSFSSLEETEKIKLEEFWKQSLTP